MRQPSNIHYGHTRPPMLALPLKIVSQRNIMPRQRIGELPVAAVVVMPEWPFAWALHGILLGSVSSGDNLPEVREGGAATGVIKS